MPTTPDVLRFKQLDSRAMLPRRGSVLAAGLDVCSIEEINLGPRLRGMARTGLAVAIHAALAARRASVA